MTKAEALAQARDAPSSSGDPRATTGASGQGLRVRGYVLVGIFPQSSTALYQDYDELLQRAEAGETDQGIIDNLLETPGDQGVPAPDLGNAPLDQIPAAQICAALPCDPSQYAVLREAQVAECTVVRGPPGTGKSQVIANLVVDALSRGERALVVCQKRAALDVVQARLHATGLTPWTYVVHDAVADQRQVYAQLRTALASSEHPAGADHRASLHTLSAEIDRTIKGIRDIVEPLRTAMHGRPLAEWYRKAPCGQRFPAPLPDELVALPWDEAKLLLERLQELRTDALRMSSDDSPLARRRSWGTLSIADQQHLLSAINTMIQTAAGQRGALVVVPRQTLNTLREALATYRQLVGRWWVTARPTAPLGSAQKTR